MLLSTAIVNATTPRTPAADQVCIIDGEHVPSPAARPWLPPAWPGDAGSGPHFLRRVRAELGELGALHNRPVLEANRCCEQSLYLPRPSLTSSGR